MFDLEPTQFFFLIIGIALIFAGLCALFLKNSPKKRASDLKMTALQLAFSFKEKGDGSIIRKFSSLPVFQSSDEGFEENVMSRGMGEAFVAILDYNSLFKGTNNVNNNEQDTNVSQVQTIVCFKTSQLSLPAFFLQPNRYFDRLYGKYLQRKFKYHRIDCQAFPSFSTYYQLFGKDEKKIREIFLNSGIVHLCEKEKDLCIEANGDILIVYRHLKQIPPVEIEQFLDLAHQAHAIIAQGYSAY